MSDAYPRVSRRVTRLAALRGKRDVQDGDRLASDVPWPTGQRVRQIAYLRLPAEIHFPLEGSGRVVVPVLTSPN
ncbi:MAG TPA: hypothetical protein VGB53_08370 [Rubricoccaceae bacterium]|jgi:hypothetical protein